MYSAVGGGCILTYVRTQTMADTWVPVHVAEGGHRAWCSGTPNHLHPWWFQLRCLALDDIDLRLLLPLVVEEGMEVGVGAILFRHACDALEVDGR
jgi:hypothetical protein